MQFTVINVQGNHVHLKVHLTCKINFTSWPEKGGSWSKQLISTSPLPIVGNVAYFMMLIWLSHSW